MTIKEVFAKYQHLDKLLCDRAWLGGGAQHQCFYDCWQAIRASEQEEAELPASDNTKKIKICSNPNKQLKETADATNTYNAEKRAKSTK